MRIYLDNCCFNRPFDDQKQLKIYLESEAKLFVQQQILDRKYELVWSYILDYENGQNPFELRKKTIFEWRNIASINVVENNDVVSFAEKLIGVGAKAKDALHISCAVYAGCKYFLTTDKKLLNIDITEINIVSPIDFLNEMED